MKKILILGVNSFSGSTFAEFIQSKKFKVYGIYHSYKNNKYILYKKKKIILKKLNNLNYLKLNHYINSIKPSIIIDFASICMVNESWKYKEYYYKVNVESKKKIVNFLKKKNFLEKYIYISTPEIFGAKKKIFEHSEKFMPSTPYAISKLKAELLFKKALKQFDFPVVFARFSNFYGPGQPIYRLIPKVCMMIDLNKKFSLHGNGITKRNFVYSEDFNKGIYKAMKLGKIGKTYHFSGDEVFSIKNVVQKICNIKKKSFDSFVKITKERKKKDDIYVLSNKFTKKELNWKSKVNFEKGLKKTIAFYKLNFDLLKKEKLEYKFIK